MDQGSDDFLHSDAFKTYWNTELRLLWSTGDQGTATTEAAAMTAKLQELQTELATARANIKQVNNNQQQLAALGNINWKS